MKYYGMDLILRHHPQHAMRCKYICAGVFITHKLWGPRIRTCFSLRILQFPLLYVDCGVCVCEYFSDIYLWKHAYYTFNVLPAWDSIVLLHLHSRKVFIYAAFILVDILHVHAKKFTHKVWASPSHFLFLSLTFSVCEYVCMCGSFSAIDAVRFILFLILIGLNIYLNRSSSTGLSIFFHFSLGWEFFQTHNTNQIALGYCTFSVLHTPQRIR